MAAEMTGDYIELPEKYGNYPIGFSIDGGGSVIKVIYRSKNEKAKNGKIKLFLELFPFTEYQKMLDFLKENCDYQGSAEITAYQTGVRIQHFDKKLTAAFPSKINMLSEFEAATKAFTTLMKVCSPNDVFYPTPEVAMLETINYVKDFATMFAKTAAQEKSANFGVEKVTEEGKQRHEAILPIVMEMLNNPDPKGLADLYTKDSDVFPCLYVICGSAFVSLSLNEDGSTTMGELTPIGGRTLLGLGQALCGAKNYDDLIDMAMKGDSNKVDVLSKDLKVEREGDTDDIYAMMPDEFAVFSLGKLHEEKYEGTFDKNDIAAGVIRIIAFNIAQLSLGKARQENLKSVVMSGTFLRHQYIREVVSKQFISMSVWIPPNDKPILRMVKNSGHMIATGAFIYGSEKAN